MGGPTSKETAVRASRKWRRAHPERKRDFDKVRKLKREYGLTIEGYDALFDSQGGCCALCGREFIQRHGRAGSPQVDHDHESGQVRGLLCPPCNAGLGAFHDSEIYLRLAIAYLRRSR